MEFGAINLKMILYRQAGSPEQLVTFLSICFVSDAFKKKKHNTPITNKAGIFV